MPHGVAVVLDAVCVFLNFPYDIMLSPWILIKAVSERFEGARPRCR